MTSDENRSDDTPDGDSGRGNPGQVLEVLRDVLLEQMRAEDSHNRVMRAMYVGTSGHLLSNDDIRSGADMPEGLRLLMRSGHEYDLILKTAKQSPGSQPPDDTPNGVSGNGNAGQVLDVLRDVLLKQMDAADSLPHYRVMRAMYISTSGDLMRDEDFGDGADTPEGLRLLMRSGHEYDLILKTAKQ